MFHIASVYVGLRYLLLHKAYQLKHFVMCTEYLSRKSLCIDTFMTRERLGRDQGLNTGSKQLFLAIVRSNQYLLYLGYESNMNAGFFDTDFSYDGTL